MLENSYFIVNPHSSNGKTGRVWDSIKKKLEKYIGQVEYEYTRYTMHASEIASRVIDAGYSSVIAVGGDGTVNEILNGFYGKGGLKRANIYLGIIPSATGGDLARTIGAFEYDMDELVKRLTTGFVQKLDHGKATFRGSDGTESTRFFINEASVGFSANTVKIVNNSSKLLGGKLCFLIGALRCLIRYGNQFMRISVDGRLWYEGPIFLVAVSNGKYFGGSMKIAPEADPFDGQFDIVLIEKFTRREVMQHIGSIYTGTHLLLPQVRSTRGSSITITSHEEVALEMDGEQPGSLNARFDIVERGINFLLPEGTHT